ncbi:hypothetical protein SDC9_184662 [bioreactor metagenome]|uniref:Uncharacterized protein n=1 Tax=bioreactor metagenome TaxID=1076179 RepID=A0A645HF10_9ZZZZ
MLAERFEPYEPLLARRSDSHVLDVLLDLIAELPQRGNKLARRTAALNRFIHVLADRIPPGALACFLRHVLGIIHPVPLWVQDNRQVVFPA